MNLLTFDIHKNYYSTKLKIENLKKKNGNKMKGTSFDGIILEKQSTVLNILRELN